MPVCLVHPSSSDNKGSCSKYGHYLNKENQELKKEGQGHRQQFFFNQDQNMITTVKAISMVDDNNKNKGLAKKQAKYYTLTLNFSQSEQEHLASTFAKRPIQNVEELNAREHEQYNEVIKLFTQQAMRNYATNFKKNIEEKQIVWFAKIEHKRRYKGTDKEVMTGRAKSGEPKKGLQTHVHITVSRMHKDYRINLSPLANARSSENLVLNGRKVKGGFDRSNWKQLNEDSFDKMFEYKRGLEEKFETLRKLKHGTLEEKLVLKAEIQSEQNRKPELQKRHNMIRAQFYFDQNHKRITRAKALSMLDYDVNKKPSKLKDNHFALTLNLTQKEQQHLVSTIADRSIENIEKLNAKEFENYNEAIQLFTQQAMHNFAISIKKNIAEKELRWFAKVEHQKKFKDAAKQVISGKVKSREFKNSLQTQIRITLSRTQRGHRIENDSLENTGISKKPKLQVEKTLEGFDFTKWKQLNRNSFDKLFGYERGFEEEKQAQRTLKHGTLKEKLVLKAEIQLDKQKSQEQQISQPIQKGKEIDKGTNKDKNNQISL